MQSLVLSSQQLCYLESALLRSSSHETMVGGIVDPATGQVLFLRHLEGLVAAERHAIPHPRAVLDLVEGIRQEYLLLIGHSHPRNPSRVDFSVADSRAMASLAARLYDMLGVNGVCGMVTSPPRDCRVVVWTCVGGRVSVHPIRSIGIEDARGLSSISSDDGHYELPIPE